MFFKVFLLMAIFAKFTTAAVAEKDFFKHTKEYEDYEYDDISEDISDEYFPIEDLADANSKKDIPETKSKEDIPEANSKKDIPEANSKEDISEANSKEDIPEANSKEDEFRKLLLNDNFTINKNGETIKEENNRSTTIIDNYDEKPETSNRPISSYEVVEIVDDIPNNVTFRPIATNFTIKLHLNNASVTIDNNKNENGNKNSIFNFLHNKDKNENLRKNSINILHVTAEFDDDRDKKPVIQNINIHQLPFGIFNVKDRVDKFKDDVFNAVHDSDVYNDPNSVYLPNILFTGTKNLLRRLREKGSAFFNKYLK